MSTEKELAINLYRHRFGCIPIIEKDVALHTYNQMIDIMIEMYEIMEDKSKIEYNRGYVDCAKTYQNQNIIEPIIQPLEVLKNEILEKIKYCDCFLKNPPSNSQGNIEFTAQKAVLLEVLNIIDAKINGLKTYQK